MSILSDMLFGTLALDHDAPVIDFRDEWFSWGDLDRSITAITACLDQIGLGEGARVGIMVQNRPDTLGAVFAAVGLDACIVSINPLLPEDKLVADLARLHLPVVIGEPSDFDRPGVLDTLREAGTAVIETEPFLKGAHLREGFAEITGTDIKYQEPDTILEMLTSGTTGTPKRIPLGREAFLKSFTGAMAYEKDRSPDDPPKLRSGIQLLTNPLTHIGGMYFALATILAGRKICLVEKFSVEGWRHVVVRHRPKIAGAVPAALRMILDADLPREDLESLVALRSGAAPLDPEVQQEFLDRYDLPVLQNYGATEFAGAVAGWSLKNFRAHWADKKGSVGRLQPGVKGRIVDPESGEELPAGEEGVLELKAPQINIGDKWLRTTDRAFIDEDGYLFIRGRADNAIIRGGFKVHPDDVVAMLETHPAVREAVVVGIPDARLGAVPAAAIMLKAGAEKPDSEALKAFVKERALPYQVPVHILFVDDVPRTPSLKPALPQVRELFR